MIRLETIEAICNAFYIPLSDFLEVLPMASQKPKKKMRISRGGDAKQILTKVRSERGIRGWSK